MSKPVMYQVVSFKNDIIILKRMTKTSGTKTNKSEPTTVKKLSIRVDDLTTRVDKLTIRVDDLTTKVDELTIRVDDLATKVDKLTTVVEKLTFVVQDGFRTINARLD
jgi:outer membrane murein-binding lipoprotein Lpp